ncbi:MAG: 23S rRNA (uracil(1939)-C(5))-methyltransferase RlmD [Ruminococcus sp.]|nr:23S rRNA (uracil(1939)-C(5))-methyltransferase RlmD [Ruminococcus sp.]
MNKLECRSIRACNSCGLSNLCFEEQLLFKQKKCEKTLSPLCKVEKITPSPSFVRYRNKAQFVFKKSGKEIRYGIYKSATHTPALTGDCRLCSERANEVAKVLCKLFASFKLNPYDFYKGTGYIKSVTVREAFATGELMVILSGASPVFPAKRTFVSALLKHCPYITTVALCVNKSEDKLFVGETKEILYGEGTITDILCDKRFLISPQSFYQINSAQCERLYEKAIELADFSGNEVVLDAYAGVGTIGICACDKVKKVFSVEQNPQAVKDAKENAAINHIDNIDFVCADSKDYIKALKEDHIAIDTAFIDPPRAGCSASFLNTLTKINPAKIIYISCNIETQARDIRILSNKGYKAQVCFPFDMFPNTGHCESVVKLIRSDLNPLRDL